MSELRDRLLKNSTIKDTDILSKSKQFNKKDMIPTKVPAINIALSGSLLGGLTPGVTIWAGPSKHFKTAFSLLMAKSYLDRYPEATLLFYDLEFGTPKDYFASFGIDPERVIYTPLLDLESLKFDCVKQLTEVKRGDKVIILIDSIGNAASKKELDDTLAEKSTQDMTRAKAIKSFFRMVTPHVATKDIPMVVICHTYMTQEMYSKAVVSGGTGPYYSADSIFIIGRQQEKDKEGVIGYNFVINVEKSRMVREKSKIPITVLHNKGISKWSGLLDLAEEAGFIGKTKISRSLAWCLINRETGELLEDQKWTPEKTETNDFWKPILSDIDFINFIEKKYKVADGEIMNFDEDSN